MMGLTIIIAIVLCVALLISVSGLGVAIAVDEFATKRRAVGFLCLAVSAAAICGAADLMLGLIGAI